MMTALLLFSGACSRQLAATRQRLGEAVVPTDVKMINHHMEQHYQELEEFTRRLYAKNPKYEPDLVLREEKIKAIFHGGEPPERYFYGQPSHEILRAAFDPVTDYGDRVYLLSLGLVKSVREAYGVEDGQLFSSLQLPLEKLETLYHNISQVNWRLKVYRDDLGELLFLTNEAAADGYLNMGYEVIMTRVLTRIADDIFLRGGSPPKFFFNMSTMFLAILF
ncbi:MAG: hypothetical protein JXO49_06140 [Deltaproteobacteria bacterium]|nr:hypothetical protein [Candidatus Anaeroferrophillus wilburensis]MBN2888906.1 hypothetical protein [Deltaproteobacteria bacterium]